MGDKASRAIGAWLAVAALLWACNKSTSKQESTESSDRESAGAGAGADDGGAPLSHGDYLRRYRPALFAPADATIPVAFEQLVAHSKLAAGDSVIDAPSEQELRACAAQSGEPACGSMHCRLDIDDGYRPTRANGTAIVYGRAVEDGPLLFLQYYMLFAEETLPPDGVFPPMMAKWLEQHANRAEFWIEGVRYGGTGRMRDGGVEMLQIILRRDDTEGYIPDAIDVAQHHYAATLPWPKLADGSPYDGRLSIHLASATHAPYIDAGRHSELRGDACELDEARVAAIACVSATPADSAPIHYTLAIPPEDSLAFQWRGRLGSTGELEELDIDDGPPMPACRATATTSMWRAPGDFHAYAVHASIPRLALEFPPLHYPPPDENTSKARDLNSRALAHHRKGNYGAALGLYAEALTADPSHILARYNLGCALALDGATEDALFVLSQLREAGCKQCVAQLAHARKDDDWKSAWSDPRFIALTAPPDARVVAGAVDTALATGDFSHLAPYVPANSKVKYTEICSVCGPDIDGDVARTVDPGGLRAIVARIHRDDLAGREGGGGPFYSGADVMVCDATCCQRKGMLSHSSVFLGGVCVAAGSRGPTLSSIGIIDGG